MVFREPILKEKPSGCYDGLSLREVLAVLVHCVYFRDLEHRAELKLAKALGYQDEDAEKAGREHWQPMAYEEIGADVDAKKLKKLGLAFFRPMAGDPHPNKNAPRLAIVLRGTLPLPQFVRDLGADAEIGLEILPESKRVMQCQDLILKVVNDFLDQGRSQDQICMAGHSLGAGIALLIGKHLVSAHDIHIDTHLFNPPLLTLATIATGEFLPGKRVQRLLDATVRRLVRKLYDEMEASGVGTLHHNDPMDSVEAEEKLDAEWKEFKKLRNWIPHFYLNPSDIICLQYIRYYEKQHEMATEENVEKSKQARITRRVFKKWFGKDVNIISNVVPSADVWISRQYKTNLLLAHSLKQWHQYPESADIRLKFQPRLLAGEW